MSSLLRLSVVLVVVVLARDTFAQTSPRSLVPVGRHAATSAGRFLGTVQDESGIGLGGVNILAVGSTLALAKTDSHGRFLLELPAGRYVVRAQRPGYVSTYRELVEVQPDSWLERTIKLMRSSPSASAQPGVAAPPPVPVEDNAGRGEVAWRLRHLSRTVLRDVSPALLPSDHHVATTFESKPLSAFFAGTAFTGQVNVFTMRSFSVPGDPSTADLSRGIANIIIGAPVGVSGDWSVRGAMLAGDASSWTLVGDYQAREDQRHKIRLGFSFSTQGYVAGRELPMSVVVPESRSVGAIHASNRWQVGPSLEVEYGMRFDRYDYLADPDLFSPRVGIRAKTFRDTLVVASASQRMIAPGADEFLPPSSNGPWLPPTRTFSSLPSSGSLRPELVRTRAIGLERAFGPNRAPVVRLEWFAQETDNQLATLYGLDPGSEVGHYYIATAGNVDVVGWRIRVTGEVLENVRAGVEYASGQAHWTGTRTAGALRSAAPAFARRGMNQISDLRASLDMSVPRSATHVALVYRLNTADRGPHSRTAAPIGEGRFNLELSQRLPYQPLDSGMLNLLFTLRTLLHDDEAGSLYDEVLTLRPPTRVTGGLQVRF